MRKGFTLLELMVVIIVIGVLATLGFVQYTTVIEKGRRGEAASILGTMRQMAEVEFQETGNYPTTAAQLQALMGAGFAAGACNGSYYFQYSMDAAGTGTATRCTGGGKAPQGTAADTMTLTIAGGKGGTVTW
ncbi:MAG: prepilin-type N-terminal cleavage/methylation domain-containing protein [Candidatus Omnitrophica bacterium]|nr:prepilin-type N-terminal cleavage/methylation domain-containing protein [Candidatus Omnitrophota bacterium]